MRIAILFSPLAWATARMALGLFNSISVKSSATVPDISWLFENVNLHGVSDVSIGGGIQYESNYAQFFLATDNLIAFYHPANNKTFSITAGICILLNHKKEVDPEKHGIKKRKGKTWWEEGED